MAKWTNDGKSAVVVMHHLVLPGETVDVPEKMLRVLEPNPPALFPRREGGEEPSVEEQPVEGEEEPSAEEQPVEKQPVEKQPVVGAEKPHGRGKAK